MKGWKKKYLIQCRNNSITAMRAAAAHIGRGTVDGVEVRLAGNVTLARRSRNYTGAEARDTHNKET